MSRVRVRRTPDGLELRVDGTFASLYRPGRETTGSVWDALAAPLLWLPPARRRNVLLLGLGGGSAARVVRALAPEARIVGVELDPDVVATARSAFGLDALGLDLHVGDARAYLAAARRRFDLILDDVFVGRGRAVRKPDWLPLPGLELAARRLAPGGVLASNTLDDGQETRRALAARFAGLVSIGIEDYDNRILAAGPPGLNARALRSRLQREVLLRPSLARFRLRSHA